jgi:protein gp37
MSDRSKIEWTDTTWNVTSGCNKCSPGCANCYALRDTWRMLGNPNPKISSRYLGTVEKIFGSGELRWTGRINLHQDKLQDPLQWRKPRMIFVDSMSDLFHPDVPFSFVDEVMEVIRGCRQHIFQIVTKRADRMYHYFNNGNTWHGRSLVGELPNMWLLTTVTNQEEAERNINLLLYIPAAVRGVSVEPMLEGIDLNRDTGGTLWIGGQRGCQGTHSHTRPHDDGSPGNRPHHHHDNRCLKGLDWVICGGETGKNARPMHPQWVRDLRDQCKVARVPFFFKSWGEWLPASQMSSQGIDSDSLYYPAPKSDPEGIQKCKVPNGVLQLDGSFPDFKFPSGAMHMFHVGKAAAGYLIDGEEWRQFPEVAG